MWSDISPYPIYHLRSKKGERKQINKQTKPFICDHTIELCSLAKKVFQKMCLKKCVSEKNERERKQIKTEPFICRHLAV